MPSVFWLESKIKTLFGVSAQTSKVAKQRVEVSAHANGTGGPGTNVVEIRMPYLHASVSAGRHWSADQCSRHGRFVGRFVVGFLAFRLLGGGVPERPVSAMIFGLVLGQRLAGMFDDCPEQWSTVPSWRHSTNYVNDDNNPAYGVPIDNSDGSDYSCLDGGYDQTLPDWKDYRRLNPLGLARMGGSNLPKDRKGYAY